MQLLASDWYRLDSMRARVNILAGALGLALYFDPARLVLKVDAGAGFVDFLSPVTCASDKSLDKVILQNS